MAMYVFLRLNGPRIDVEEMAVVDLMRSVAQSDGGEEKLVVWLEMHAT
jgi:prophage maintenance system killer protein